MTFKKPNISFIIAGFATASLMWPAASFAQDCDFWTGDCTVTATDEITITPSAIEGQTSESECDFWSGDCQEKTVATSAPEQDQSKEDCDLPVNEELPAEECLTAEAAIDSFWTQSHSEEVKRRRVAEVARIEADRQAELRRIEIDRQAEVTRLAELKAIRLKRQAIEREREQRREDARREERRLAAAQRRNPQPRGPSTADILLGALQNIERDLGREVNKINAETERRRAANERAAAQRRAQQQARQDRENDAQIAALDKRVRDVQQRADLKATQQRQFAQRLKRETEEEARQQREKARQQQARARALSTSGSSGSTSSSRNRPSSSSSQSGFGSVSRSATSWMDNAYSACLESAQSLVLERQRDDSADAIAAYRAACLVVHRIKYSLPARPSKLQCSVKDQYMSDASKALSEKGLAGYTSYAGQAWDTWKSNLGCR